MKINKMMLIALIAALPAFPLSAQQPPDDMDEERMEQPAMGPGGAQMGPGMGMNRPQQNQGIMGKRGMNQNSKFRGEMGPGVMNGRAFGLPEEVEAKVMFVIKKNDPAFANKLAQLKNTNEKKYDITLGIAAKFLNMAQKADDPALEKDVVKGISLEYDVRELSFQYEKASDADKTRIREQMKGKLNELFDIRARGQEARIAKMEKEIAGLKDNVQKRKENKAKIVDSRLQELTGNKDLSW